MKAKQEILSELKLLTGHAASQGPGGAVPSVARIVDLPEPGVLLLKLGEEVMISRDFLLPEGCPDTALRHGYKPARIVTPAEFDDIVVHELEAGNYNILLAERAF